MLWRCSNSLQKGSRRYKQRLIIHSTPSTFSFVLQFSLLSVGLSVPFNTSWGVCKKHWWVNQGSVTYSYHSAGIIVKCQKEGWSRSAYYLLSFFTTHLAWFMFWSALKMTLKRFGPEKWCRNHKMQGFSQKEPWLQDQPMEPNYLVIQVVPFS